MKLIEILLGAVLAGALIDPPLSDISEFVSGNFKFTADLCREICKENPNTNFVFSPFSIEVILALVREGAKGKTEQELTTGLSLPDQERTGEALRLLRRDLKKNSDELELLSANKIYLDKKYQILDSFKKVATSSAYEADIETVNFENNVEAANIINQWVEQQTKNKIKDLISPDNLNTLTKVVLVNCLYFNGKWTIPFVKKLTNPQKFHVTKSQQKEVDMMEVKGLFRYYECQKGDARFVELPYQGENISMTIALPNDIEGLPRLKANLDKFLSVRRKLAYQHVAVSLPRFEVESKLELKPILKNLGINSIFLDADFSGISNDPLIVDEVVQKAFINVTESGTEAAAATSATLFIKSSFVGTVPPFIADHPFIYFIIYNDIVLFCGQLAV